MSDDDAHITQRELDSMNDKIDAAVREIKKEVRWLLLLGLAGSQLVRNIDIPPSLTTTGAIIAAAAFVGKASLSFFFAR